jgi:hypothetical protein
MNWTTSLWSAEAYLSRSNYVHKGGLPRRLKVKVGKTPNGCIPPTCKPTTASSAALVKNRLESLGVGLALFIFLQGEAYPDIH